MKKKYFKFGDKKMGRYFNWETWRRMTESEQSMWIPEDKKPWPKPPPRESGEEIHKRMAANETKKGMDNLRLKKGMTFNLLGTELEILQWGPRRHLISHHRTGSDKIKFGTLLRETEDSSWGLKDILRNYMQYSSFITLKEAEQEYEFSNR